MKRSLGIAAAAGVCAVAIGAVAIANPVILRAAPGASTTLKDGDRQHVLKDAFIESRNVADIPLPVKRSMAAGGPMSVADGEKFSQGNAPFRMANPNEAFQVGDAISDPKLPWSRLRFVATSWDYSIVEFETGGFAHFTTVALYRMPPPPRKSYKVETRPATLIWKVNVRKMHKSWKELRTDIALNALK